MRRGLLLSFVLLCAVVTCLRRNGVKDRACRLRPTFVLSIGHMADQLGATASRLVPTHLSFNREIARFSEQSCNQNGAGRW